MALKWIDYTLLILVIYCSYTDIRYKKIKNTVTFSLMILGLIYNTYIHGLGGLVFALQGLLVGSLFLLIALIGKFGMGDVKLIMGIGAVKGAVFCIDLIVYSLLASVIIAVLISPRKFFKALTNVCYMLKNLFWFGIFLKPQESALILPYAVCICGGLILTYLGGGDTVWALLRN